MPDAPLPFTPRGLRAELAATYVGVSVAWWREAVAVEQRNIDHG